MPRRLRQFNLFSLMVLVTLAAIGMALHEPTDRPSIDVKKTTIDIGAVASGASGTCNFVLNNRSDHPVRIIAGNAG